MRQMEYEARQKEHLAPQKGLESFERVKELLDVVSPHKNLRAPLLQMQGHDEQPAQQCTAVIPLWPDWGPKKKPEELSHLCMACSPAHVALQQRTKQLAHSRSATTQYKGHHQ